MFLCIPSFFYAQESNLFFKHLGSESGLEDGWINSFITKDSKGFAWINGQNGFYRFDGQGLKYYSLSQQNRSTPFNEYIQSPIWEDNYHKLWFTTVSALHQFDPKSEQFESFQFTYNGGILDQENQVFFLEKQADYLWLFADSVFWQYDLISHKNITPYFPTNGRRFTVDTSQTGEVNRIIAIPWIEAPGVEVWEKDKNGDWCVFYPSGELFSNTYFSKAIIENDSTLWLTSMDKGLVAFDPNKKLWKGTYLPGNGNVKRFWNGAFIHPERLLLSSHNDGLWLFDTSSKLFTKNWLKTENSTGSISSNRPRDLYVDTDQRLWITQLDGGVDYSIGYSTSFFNPLKKDDGKFNLILKILEDESGNIWAMSQDQGIFVFNLEGKQLHHFPKVGIAPSPNQQFKFMSLDSIGRIWVVTSDGIFYNSQVEEFSSKKWTTAFNGDNNFFSIYHGVSGRILVTSNSSVFDLIEKEDSFQLAISPEFDKYNNYEFDYFFKGQSGTSFAPFNGHSLWLLDNKENALELEEEHKIASDTYDVVSAEGSDSVWIATGRGLFLYLNKQLEQILGQDSLGEQSSIYSVTRDQLGGLWLTTGDGLWHYEPTGETLLKYTVFDGLMNNKFSFDADLLASDGKIWLGTKKGMTVFHPETIQKNEHIPNIYINDLWLNNKKYESDIVIDEHKEIRLQYFQDKLEFELRTIDFYQPDKNKIKYRLIGFDNEWTFINNGGIARFTKVPPGTYRFEAIPISANHTYGKKKTLDIIIPPPFWKTWWFSTSIGLAIVLIIAISVGQFYRRKLRQQQQLIEREKAISEERNRIAKELHDDMGASLSSILFLSEDLLLEDAAVQSNEVHRISNLAEKSLENMREIIWALDTGKNTYEDLCSQLRTLATTLLSDNKIQFEPEFMAASNNDFLLGNECRRNVFLIAKEGLHNIIKHAKASRVKMKLTLVDQKITLKIEDNGQGFDEQLLTSTGYGLNNMRERALAIGGQLEIKHLTKGTCLCLTIAL